MLKSATTFLALAGAVLCGVAHADVTCQPLVMSSSLSAQLLSGNDDDTSWQYGLLGDGTTNLGFGGTAPDLLDLEIYYDGSPGTFDLSAGDDANYATCAHCVLLYRDIDPDAGPAKTFFQTAGALTYVDTAAESQTELDVQISGLRLVEVTIDPGTFVSTPVPDGECYVQAEDKIFLNGFDSAP